MVIVVDYQSIQIVVVIEFLYFVGIVIGGFQGGGDGVVVDLVGIYNFMNVGGFGIGVDKVIDGIVIKMMVKSCLVQGVKQGFIFWVGVNGS